MFRQITCLRVNVTEEGVELGPLLDVLMILLGATLLVAAMPLYASLHTTLEEESGPSLTPGEVNEVLIGFDGDGHLSWNNDPLPDLTALEARAIQETSDNMVRFLIAGDRDAPYGFSLRVKSALQRAGVSEVQELIRQPKGD